MESQLAFGLVDPLHLWIISCEPFFNVGSLHEVDTVEDETLLVRCRSLIGVVGLQLLIEVLVLYIKLNSLKEI